LNQVNYVAASLDLASTCLQAEVCMVHVCTYIYVSSCSITVLPHMPFKRACAPADAHAHMHAHKGKCTKWIER